MVIWEDGPGAPMVHPKANTADGAKSVSYPRVFAGRKVATCVAEAAAWRCKCAQPPDSVGNPADVDDGLAGVVEPTSVGEHKRDRPNTSHAGYDYHTGHDLGAGGHFHADRHLDFRRHLMPAIIRLRARSGDHRQPAIIQQSNARGAHDARPLWQLWLPSPGRWRGCPSAAILRFNVE